MKWIELNKSNINQKLAFRQRASNWFYFMFGVSFIRTEVSPILQKLIKDHPKIDLNNKEIEDLCFSIELSIFPNLYEEYTEHENTRFRKKEGDYKNLVNPEILLGKNHDLIENFSPKNIREKKNHTAITQRTFGVDHYLYYRSIPDDIKKLLVGLSIENLISPLILFFIEKGFTRNKIGVKIEKEFKLPWARNWYDKLSKILSNK